MAHWKCLVGIGILERVSVRVRSPSASVRPVPASYRLNRLCIINASLLLLVSIKWRTRGRGHGRGRLLDMAPIAADNERKIIGRKGMFYAAGCGERKSSSKFSQVESILPYSLKTNVALLCICGATDQRALKVRRPAVFYSVTFISGCFDPPLPSFFLFLVLPFPHFHFHQGPCLACLEPRNAAPTHACPVTPVPRVLHISCPLSPSPPPTSPLSTFVPVTTRGGPWQALRRRDGSPDVKKVLLCRPENKIARVRRRVHLILLAFGDATESASLESAFDSTRLRTTILFVQVGCFPTPQFRLGDAQKLMLKFF